MTLVSVEELEKLDKLLTILKKHGMRKMAYGTLALLCIVGLCAIGRLEGMVFAGCFTALIASVMAANSQEHKHKKEEPTNATPA